MSIASTLTTPFDVLKVGLKKAFLEVISPASNPTTIIQLCFNPTEYQRSKANTFAEIGIPGLESPPIQYVRGEAEKLTVELLADTSDTLNDVRVRYTNPIRELMNINCRAARAADRQAVVGIGVVQGGCREPEPDIRPLHSRWRPASGQDRAHAEGVPAGRRAGEAVAQELSKRGQGVRRDAAATR